MSDIRDISTDIDNVSVSRSYLLNEPEDCKFHLDILRNDVSIISMNIRSINKNFDDFLVLLSRIDFNFDILILSECWLTEHYNPSHLQDYNSFYTLKYLNQNDGLVVYIKNNIKKVKVHEPNFCNANCLIILLGKELCVIAVYRPPSFANITNFLNSLEELLLKYRAYPNIVVVGDININIYDNPDDRRLADEYLTLLASHGILPGHQFVTRDLSNTCLDHIMLKTKNRATTLVLPAIITDHSPVIALFSIRQKLKTEMLHKTYNKTDINAICLELSKINWNNTLDISDLDQATENFLTVISNLIKVYTKTIRKPRSKANIKPWITAGLIKCMRKRDKLHSKSKKDPENKQLRKTYIDYRNVCNKILKKLKRMHDRLELKKNNNDSKKTWKTIKRICDFPLRTNPVENLIKNGNNADVTLANINKYYINVGSNLAHDTLMSLNRNEHDLALQTNVKNKNLSSFGLLPTDVVEVHSTIQNLKNDSAPGWDRITAKLMKLALPHLLEPITAICQESFNMGIFPSALKKSVICPIHKGGNDDDIMNYRPISLLPIISKVLEKLMNNRLKKFLETKNLLSPNQYGFRSGRSTEDAVLMVTDDIIKHLDKGENCVGIFLDLAKAFDTVSIPILLAKLEMIGIRGTSLHWFKSYLTNRTQRTRVGNYISSEDNTKFGVPQGSILGPTLFLIYINDLCDMSLHNAKIVTYADDTVLLFHGKTWNEVETVANVGLGLVSNWLRNTLLTINISKTNYISFSITKTSQPKQPLQLKMHGSKCSQPIQCSCPYLSQKDNIKYLGIILDKNLSWKNQIVNLAGRTRKLIFIFKKLRHALNFEPLIKVYYALAQSILTYCIRAWGAAAKTHMVQLERAQRALLKVIKFKPKRYSTSSLYKECSVLSIRQLFIKAALTKQHALVNSDTIEVRKSRRRKDRIFKIPKTRTKYGTKSTGNIGPLLYNHVSKYVTIVDRNFRDVKKLLNDYLMALNYCETESLIN